MPKPVLAEVVTDLLPFQQAVSNELGKLAGQIYARGEAGGELTVSTGSPAGLTVPRAVQTLLASWRGTFPRFPIDHHAEEATLQIFSLSTAKRCGGRIFRFLEHPLAKAEEHASRWG